MVRIPELLAPSDRLLVVNLAHVNALPDLAADLISAAANPVMGLIKHPRPARPADGPAAGQPVMPVKDAATTLAEITAAARAHLPGATLRRRLFFRYTLRWDKPPVTAPPPAPATLEPGNHRTAIRPAPRKTSAPRRARAGAGKPRQLQPAVTGRAHYWSARRAYRRRSGVGAGHRRRCSACRFGAARSGTSGDS